MTPCPKPQADLLLDGVGYRFATPAEALDTYRRLAGLRGATWTTAGRRRWSLPGAAPQPRDLDDELRREDRREAWRETRWRTPRGEETYRLPEPNDDAADGR